MKPLAARYLAKSRECLASAGADLAAGRNNSVANRAYYAAFQAAIALLTEASATPRGSSWEHKHVLSQFSAKLIRQRKIIPARFKGTLSTLLELRIVADYKERSLSGREAIEMHGEATDLVNAVAERLGD